MASPRIRDDEFEKLTSILADEISQRSNGIEASNDLFWLSNEFVIQVSKLFPDGTRGGQLMKMVVRSFRIAATLGTRELLHEIYLKFRKREFRLLDEIPPALQFSLARGSGPVVTKIEEPSKTFHFNITGLAVSEADVELVDMKFSDGEKEISDNSKFSAIIFSRSARDADIVSMLRRLGLQGAAIFVVNQGQRNLSAVAIQYQAKILSWSEFYANPSVVMSMAIEKASVDYVFLLSAEAIPVGRRILDRMVTVLENDKQIAVVTARQLPTSSANIMTCYNLWKQNGVLERKSHGSLNLRQLIALGGKHLIEIDQFCTCFRREAFMKYISKIGQATPLELGIGVIRDGFKVMSLVSDGVITSDGGAVSDLIWRSYKDVRTLSGFMEYDFTKFKEMWNTKDCSLNNTIISVSGLYNGVCCAIDELREQEFHGGDLAEILQTLETRFGSSEIGNVESQRAGISNLVTELSNLLEHDNECIYHHDALGLRYLESAREFTEWLSSSFPALSGLEEEYVDALYKILGIEIGRLLGEYSAWALLNEAPESNISKLDRCLSRNTL